MDNQIRESAIRCILLRMEQVLLPNHPLIFDGRPFTGAEAEQLGVGRNKLHRMCASNVIRPVVRGVYVDASVDDSLPLRAAAVAKIAPEDAVVCRRTAAWLLGIDLLALHEQTETPRIDVVRPSRRRALKISSVNGHSQTLLAGDVVEWQGLRITSPLATAVHLARHLHRPFALSALDALARAKLIAVPDLRSAVERYRGHPGIKQARELAALTDPAAESPAESWLRLRIVDAGFPPPRPQVVVSDGTHDYRIDLGFTARLPGTGRRLGLEYDSDMWHGSSVQLAADERRRRELECLGWDLLSVRRGEIWGRDPALERAVGDLLGIEPRLPRRW